MEKRIMNCVKCTNKAIGFIEINQKSWPVCQEHIPENTPLQEPTPLQELYLNNHIISLQGKEYILFGGLLYLAHKQGLKSIHTEIIEHNRAEKFAIVKATVTGEKGTFSSYGDADPATCGKKIQDAYIRMADTRATARALRFYCGIGITALDELPTK